MVILYVFAFYLLMGMIFSVPFLLKWITTLDEGARDSSWAFRIILLPGCIVFWPALLKKYWKTKSAKS